MGDFSERVYHVVASIPAGKVASYGTVARLMGSPRSARYVGFALRNNPSPGSGLENIPCHRVLFKDGSLCEGFIFGGPGAQRELLEAEGVTFADNNHVDMAACEWDGSGFVENASSSETEGGAAGKDTSVPTAPPADFDWQAELGE